MNFESTKIKDNCLDKKLLLDVILAKVPFDFQSLVIEAVEYLKVVHKDQYRKSGEQFIFHPLNVAAIVAELNLDVNSILAALLHNSLKDRDRKSRAEVREEIRKNFGKEVYTMVETINKFSKGTRSHSHTDVITKYILASTDDVRLIIIKLADRLHNARTIDALSKADQKHFAKSIIDIYSPLCTYLNLYDFKKELEESAFRILNPEEYKRINKHLQELDIGDTDRILKIRKHLLETVMASGIKPVIYGRIKGHYSIYRKLREKQAKGNFNIEDLKDLIAFTILTENEDQCYAVAKLIMQSSDIHLKEYDDYIKSPKQNGYRALHIVTKFPAITDKPIEVQIKTEMMHQFNIYGPASHITYKLERELKRGSPREYYWVKEMHKKIYEYQQLKSKSRSTPIRSDVFKNKVYVFTPKDKLIELPVGATVVDFAYEIHSSLGNSMSGCKINGKKAQVRTMLKNGDRVEVVTDDKQTLPSREWLRFVRTRKARDEIENAFNRDVENMEFRHVI